VGSSQADKAASHERIVRNAAARIRRNGIDGLSIGELMAGSGLTHGGFYRHFGSRDELIVEAVRRALAEGSARTAAVASSGDAEALGTIIDAYLSRLHRDKPETGCAVAALPADVARGDARGRAAYGDQVVAYLDLLSSLLSEGDDRGTAFLILAALVGGVSMARAVDDPELSDAILQETAAALKRTLAAGAQPSA
jgi:TetR/AcrR family transcriptional regulator, transcriptional repressor for nem operon